MRILFSVFLGLLTSTTFLGQGQSFGKGTVTETLVTNDTLDLPYSVFLPVSYSKEKPSQVIFVFDPDGEGVRAARLFASSVDVKDFVIVANNFPIHEELDSLNTNANRAVLMMRDVFLKLNIDTNEVYLAGLRSGAQLASALSYFITNASRLLLIDGVYLANNFADRINRNLVMGIVGKSSPNYYQMADYFYTLNAANSDNTLYEYQDTGNWPSASFLGVLIRRLEHLNAERFNKDADSLYQEHYGSDLEALKTLSADEKYLTAYDLAVDLKGDYRRHVDLDNLRDFQRSLRRSSAYKKAKRTNRTGSLEENLLLEDISYFLEQDLASANFENLGYWDEKIRQFERAAETGVNPNEQHVAKRMLGYIDYRIEDFLTLNRVGLLPHRIFGNVLRTILEPKDYQAYLNIISLSAQDDDENTAYFYLEELLKQGYTDYDSLYEIPETQVLKIKPTYNQLIQSYLGKSKF